jgi:hypothetical protein
LEDADLDQLASDWRGALDAAEDTLDAIRRCRALHFPPSELRDRCKVLAHARVETEKSLEELARTTHTHLRTSVVRRGGLPRAAR